jgi:hypothetical protein
MLVLVLLASLFAVTGTATPDCPHARVRDSIAVPIGVLLPDRLIASLEPVMRLALKHVKEHHCIMNGYHLEPIAKDTQVGNGDSRVVPLRVLQCKTSLGMKALFDLMKTEEAKPVALFGDACTNVNEVGNLGGAHVLDVRRMRK